MLSINNLYKSFGGIQAINNVSLNIEKSTVTALIGPNGAGKTTFINILAGTVIKTEGQVSVCGFDLDKDPRQVRASVGIVPQEINLDPFFSPKKLLELQAGLYGVKKKDRITDTILKLVALEDQANSYARGLSGGMKRRLLMAKALVHQPPIVFLDEPTAGVDVELRKNLWKNVRMLNDQGVTIILTTHYLEEAEEMCDRIAILNKGNVVALDSTKNLLNKIQTKKITFKTDKKVTINDGDLDTLKIISILENEICVSYEKNKIKIEELMNLIKKNNVQITDISTDDGDLEDVFLRLIKN